MCYVSRSRKINNVGKQLNQTEPKLINMSGDTKDKICRQVCIELHGQGFRVSKVNQSAAGLGIIRGKK